MKSEILFSVGRGHTRVDAVLGDMTEEIVDVIVNAANSQLQHGGGLAGALVRRGGRSIQAESSRVAPVPVGGAAVTSAGTLHARWIVHAVGPRWGEGDEEQKLRSAIRASLGKADELKARSIALPAISTGIFGYPKQAGVRTIVDELFRWLDENPNTVLRLVHLTAFDEPTAALFAQELQNPSVP
ncbi:MAG: macro domain-containing protein [Acidobacteria bacterium]|nr:macro domain-containing protein [Acidobacteriota bacterium]